MFDIESKKPNYITIKTNTKTINFDLDNSEIDADLKVGKIHGPGEFEIGEATIRGISSKDKTKTVYEVEVGGVKIGIIGDCEDILDELDEPRILCTSSVRAIREVSPRLVVATGNVDGMVTELKLTATTDKHYKVKNADALPVSTEVVVLN